MTREPVRITFPYGNSVSNSVTAGASPVFELTPQSFTALWEHKYAQDPLTDEAASTHVVNDEKITEEKPRYEARAALLDEAKRLVCQDRNAHYGPPTMNFSQFAAIANTLGYRAPGKDGPGTEPLEPHDVAILQLVLKLVRVMWSPYRRDNWADTAGYAACGWECVTDGELNQQDAA